MGISTTTWIVVISLAVLLLALAFWYFTRKVPQDEEGQDLEHGRALPQARGMSPRRLSGDKPKSQAEGIRATPGRVRFSDTPQGPASQKKDESFSGSNTVIRKKLAHVLNNENSQSSSLPRDPPVRPRFDRVNSLFKHKMMQARRVNS